VIDIGIDESQSGSLLVVSAIVGKTPLMRKLSREWKRELAQSGVDFIHAKDHWNMQYKPYHGISRDEREKLLNRVICHLHNRSLFGASTIVDEVRYKNAASDRFRSQFGSPYGWGFQMLMVMIHVELLRQRKHDQPVNILIEDGHANCEQAMQFIRRKKDLEAKNGPRGLRVNNYGLGGKKGNPILQAADLLAYGVCEYHTNGSSDFAARLAADKHGPRLHELPWDESSVEAAKQDINRHSDMRRSGVPGAKRHGELVMW
jgi:hypothetical protein